jgi:hypothetical protein
MRVVSKVSAAAAALVLWVGVLASPASADEEVFTATVDGSGTLEWKSEQARANQKRLGEPLVMAGKTRAGINTNITCFIGANGPLLFNSRIAYETTLDCYGGTPQLLQVRQNIARHIVPGLWRVEPDSYASCSVPLFSIMACMSTTRCAGSGSYYDAYAQLHGIDENGVSHYAEHYEPVRWVGCII